MELYYEKTGEGPPLVMLHGLFGSADNWRSHARWLDPEFTVYRVDLRNHGRSPHSRDIGFDHMVEDVIELLEQLGLHDLSLTGHSMGGKVAMGIALAAPSWIRKLVVVDMAPREYPPINGPIMDALAGVDLEATTDRAAVERQLKERLPDARIAGFLLKSLETSADAPPRWQFNLAALREGYPRILENIELGDAVYPGPALFVRGAESPYVRDEDVPVIERHFPRQRLVTIAGAGHWLHADRPREFHEVLREFLLANQP